MSTTTHHPAHRGAGAVSDPWLTSPGDGPAQVHVLTRTDLADILDALPSLVVFVDAEEHNCYANRAAASWLGRPPHEIVGKSVRELLGEEGYRAAQPHVEAALRGEARSFERSLTSADGSVAHTVTEYLPRVRDGRPDGFVAVVTDVTGQVLADAALRARTRTAALTNDTVLQELFAVGLHLERLRRVDGDAVDVVTPLVDSISAQIERLRDSIELLLSSPERGSETPAVAFAGQAALANHKASASTSGPTSHRSGAWITASSGRRGDERGAPEAPRSRGV